MENKAHFPFDPPKQNSLNWYKVSVILCTEELTYYEVMMIY